MTETYFPFDGGNGADVRESQWREMARHWRSTGVLNGALNSLQVYADSSGMQVKLKTGEAIVDGFKYKNGAELIIAIPAAHPTYGRIDRIVLRLDVANNLISAKVLAGTPSAVPAVPSLTQVLTGTYEISLAKITVAAAATNLAAGTVTDERTYSVAIVNAPLKTEYDSGWFAAAYNNTYTLTHLLGGIPKAVIVYWCSTNTPASNTKIYEVYAAVGPLVVSTTLAFDESSIFATAANQATNGTKYAADGTISGGGYWRVRAWR
jgi:hypothetical protein